MEDTALRLAETLYSQNNFEAVLRVLGKVVKNNPQCDLAFQIMAATLVDLGRFKDAVKAASRAIQINSAEQRNWFTLGTAHYYLFQFGPAIEAFQRTSELEGDKKVHAMFSVFYCKQMVCFLY